MQSITELNAVKKKRAERQIVSEYFPLLVDERKVRKELTINSPKLIKELLISTKKELFSDDNKYNLFVNNGRGYVWRKDSYLGKSQNLSTPAFGFPTYIFVYRTELNLNFSKHSSN